MKTPTNARRRGILKNAQENGIGARGRNANGHTLKESSCGDDVDPDDNLLHPPHASDIARPSSPTEFLSPIHRFFQQAVHKYEIPRKLLHVGFGLVLLGLYVKNYTAPDIYPYLAAELICVVVFDYLRFQYAGLNRVYIRLFGPIMRQSEVNDWNGVIWYLVGTYSVLVFFPLDIAIVSIMLLSWCDTAASVVGRWKGHLTPSLRKGKSLAGTVAAMGVGSMAAFLFWGITQPYCGKVGPAFDPATAKISLASLCAITGIVAGFSEFVDVYALDDNIVIPIIAGISLWALLVRLQLGS